MAGGKVSFCETVGVTTKVPKNISVVEFKHNIVKVYKRMNTVISVRVTVASTV